MHQTLKYRWRVALRSLLIIAGISVYGSAAAHHILGGEVSYTNISAKKYKFTLKLYRNCNNCEFNTSGCAAITDLAIYASPEELSFAKKLGSIPLSKVSRKDVTSVCKGVTSKCAGGAFPNGIEEWVFEGYYDFDSIKEYCRFEIAIRVDSRADIWSTGEETFYNFARLNICNGGANHSPVFQAPVYYLLEQNQSFTYNILAEDADGDSLSYKLVKAQRGWNTNVNYPSGYGATKPLDIYCPSGNCALDKTKWPVEGMGIEAENGWMGFTPTVSGQAGFVVVEVTEWRKISGTWVAIGVSRRDLQVQVVDLGNNATKISTSASDYFACAGKTFLLDFSILDPAYFGMKDSVTLSFKSELGGGTIGKVGSSKNQFDGVFSLPIGLNQIRNKPYYVTLIATDNHCPLVSTTYKTISITVTGVPKSASKVEFKECNKIEFSTAASGNEFKNYWFLFSGSTLLETKSTANGTFEVPNPGTYYIRHQVTNVNTGCEIELTDTIVVPYFSLLKPDLNWPEKVCKNVPFAIAASFTGGTGPFNYWWDGALGNDTLKLSLEKDATIGLTVRDDLGCRMVVSKSIKVFTTPDIVTNDTAMCLPATGKKVSLNNRISITPTFVAGNFVFEYLGSDGQISSSGNEHFFEPTKSVDHQFIFRYTDENACKYDASFVIKVVDPLPTGIQSPKALCNNNQAVDLDQATGCLLSDGVWKSDMSPDAVMNGLFDPSLSGAGTFDLVYYKNESGCMIRDTTEIQVNKAPVVSIVKPLDSVFCSSASNIFLNANPSGGVWENDVNAAMPNLFSPADIIGQGYRTANYIYTFTDKQNGCKASDILRLRVNPAPQINMASTYELCGGSELMVQPDVKNAARLELTGDFSLFDVQRVDASYLFRSQAVNQRTLIPFAFTASGLPGCSDEKLDFNIAVKPLPDITVSALPDKGCSPFSTVLQVKSTNPKALPTAYFWADGQNWNPGVGFRALTLANSGVYNYEVKASLEGCTSDIARAVVEVYESPKAQMEIDPRSRTVSADFTNLTFKDVSVSAVSYSRLWEFESGSPATSDKARVSVDFPKDTGLYSVRLSIRTTDGCESFALQNIRVRPGLQFYVPNAFTPDRKGPESNEVFKVIMDSAVSFHCTIRNRWGELLFTSNSQDKGWDGTYLGEKVPAGVYVWEVEASTIYGGYVLKRGTVSLLR